MSTQTESRRYPRRHWMTYTRIMGGADVRAAVAATDAALKDNPQWDGDEELTWTEWMTKPD